MLFKIANLVAYGREVPTAKINELTDYRMLATLIEVGLPFNHCLKIMAQVSTRKDQLWQKHEKSCQPLSGLMKQEDRLFSAEAAEQVARSEELANLTRQPGRVTQVLTALGNELEQEIFT